MGANKSFDLDGYIDNTGIANYLRRSRSQIPPEGSCNIIDMGKYKVLFKLDRTLSVMDCAILDAAEAFYAGNRREFAVRDIIAFMYGRDSISVTPEKLDKFYRSLKWLSGTEMRINLVDEHKDRFETDKEAGKRVLSSLKNLIRVNGMPVLAGSLLPLEETGKKAKKFRFSVNKTPVLYEYANTVNHQCIRYPRELLKPVAGLQNTERALLERRWLIHRIEVLSYLIASNKKNQAKGFSEIHLKRYQPNDIIPQLVWSGSPEDREAYDEGSYVFANASYTEWSAAEEYYRRMEVYKDLRAILGYFRELGYIGGFEVMEGGSGGVSGLRLLEPRKSFPKPP